MVFDACLAHVTPAALREFNCTVRTLVSDWAGLDAGKIPADVSFTSKTTVNANHLK